MNRRRFLRVAGTTAATSSAAAIVASWPLLLREAFAQAKAADAPAGLAVVSEGFRKAQRAGKPLLVLIVPTDDGVKWARGRAFGAWLNHARDEQLWPLALCEVACATMADLRALVPSAGPGHPLMVLVETDQLPATVRRLDARLPEVDAGRPRGDSWEQRVRREEQAVDAQIAVLSTLLEKGLRDGDAFARRATQARAVLPAAVASLADHPATLVPEQADQVAGLLGPLVGRGRDKEGQQLVAVLAKGAKQRLTGQRVPGSAWATSHGCGTRIEGEQVQHMIACGMGHVPAKSTRFLYFFTLPKNGGREIL
jgi:hypothetical protein